MKATENIAALNNDQIHCTIEIMDKKGAVKE
jgi:hypothetical protein